jgi:P63C domain-containing protein
VTSSPDDEKQAAKAFALRGASKGGRARASVLSPEERSEIARRASRARWATQDDSAQQGDNERVVEDEPSDTTMPYSMFPGTVEIGTVTLECHVLNDGRRVLASGGVVRALRGTDSKPASLSRYLAALPTYDPGMLDGRMIRFRIPSNPTVAQGYEAKLLIEICDLYLDARDKDLLKANQKPLAKMAEIIVRACAKVGIEALVDEATGYQQVRERRALQIKLQAFIAEEMQEWVKTFPEEFWQELARLEGIRYTPKNRPLRWGKYVMRFVYDSIDPDLGKKLREINPSPQHRRNHHQWLREFGRDRLHQQLGGTIAIMKSCKDMDEFRRRFASVFGRDQQLSLDFDWIELT